MTLIIIIIILILILHNYNYVNLKKMVINCLILFCKYTHYKILLFISYILSHFNNKRIGLDNIKHVLYKSDNNKIENCLKKSIANLSFNSMLYFKGSKYLLSKIDLPEKLEGNNYLLGCHIGFYFGYNILENFLTNDFIYCKKRDYEFIYNYNKINKIEYLYFDDFNFTDLEKNMKTKSLVVLTDTYRKSIYKIQVDKLNTSIISFFPILFKKIKRNVYFYIIYFDFSCEKFIKLKMHKIGDKNSNIPDILQEYGKLWMYYSRKYPEQNLWTLGNFLFSR